MPKTVNIQLRECGKIHPFDPKNLGLKHGDPVIVETTKGLEYGTVVGPIHDVTVEMVRLPLNMVIRIATTDDMTKHHTNVQKEKHAFQVGQTKIVERELDMLLVDVEYAFDGTKIIFYFTADGRIDFRELVKDLASIFRNRIELRQIGVRDEAKMVGGLGICGRELCCCSFLHEFMPVSVKMAKEQNLSMNPTKISGACGRLMCCLKYEQEAYEYANSRMPRIGTLVDTPQGKGVVQDINLLSEIVKVRLDKGDELDLSEFHLDEITFENRKIRKSSPERGCPMQQRKKKAPIPDSDPSDDLKNR
jgi:cell fate regulator YaaT (PSP1 superfamily)